MSPRSRTASVWTGTPDRGMTIGGAPDQQTVLHRVEYVMGMPVGIDIRDQEVDPTILDVAFDWLRSVDAMFSTYKPESQISRINTGDLTIERAHPDVRSVLRRCEQVREDTSGYFDIRTERLPVTLTARNGNTFSSGIDPSGFVKGWSVDRAAELLDGAGARNYSINAGGDLRVRGGALPDSHWRIGIQHPFIRDQVAAVVGATDLAVATSGTYARGQHIIDPHTGLPPVGVLSVTVTGPELALADAFATAAYAMGKGGPEWTARLFGYDALTIRDDDTVLSTRWFPAIAAS